MAPDAAEIQLKSPNWLFGQRKFEDVHTNAATANNLKAGNLNEVGAAGDENRIDGGLCHLHWLSSISLDDTHHHHEEPIFERYLMTSIDKANGWYGGTLLGDQDENSEIYKHYAELCQGSAMEPFEHDEEKERDYADMVMRIDDDIAVEREMEKALGEYHQIGSDLGVLLHPFPTHHH